MTRKVVDNSASNSDPWTLSSDFDVSNRFTGITDLNHGFWLSFASKTPQFFLGGSSVVA